MNSIPTRLPASIRVYCAQCRKHLGESEDKHLYLRVRCPENPTHLAAVVKGSSGEFWLRIEAAILKWETDYSPMRWFDQWKGFFKGRAGRYLFARFVILVGLLVLAYYQSALGYVSIVLPIVLALAILFLLADILISNTSIAFVSRFPAHPLRTVLFTAFAFVQIGVSFAILYILFGDFNLPLNPISATYFSFVTITTLGYGDIHLNEGAWLGQLIVIFQLFVGVYFISILFAVVSNWSNASPSSPPICELSDVTIRKTV